MFFSSSVYFKCGKGPLSSDPEEHQLRSGLWPVLAFWTAAFWTASSESESESWVFLGALVLVGVLPFGVSLVFIVGVGDQVLSDCLSGDGTDTFLFFLGIPEGYSFEGAVFNAPSGSSSDLSVRHHYSRSFPFLGSLRL